MRTVDSLIYDARKRHGGRNPVSSTCAEFPRCRSRDEGERGDERGDDDGEVEKPAAPEVEMAFAVATSVSYSLAMAAASVVQPPEYRTVDEVEEAGRGVLSFVL